MYGDGMTTCGPTAPGITPPPVRLTPEVTGITGGAGVGCAARLGLCSVGEDEDEDWLWD